MVGALVLIAIAVIFVPMLFNRQDDLRHVTVDAPSIPAAPVVAEIEMEPVDVPEPQSVPEGFEIIEEGAEPDAAPPAVASAPAPIEPVAPAAPTASAPATPEQPAPAKTEPPVAEPRLDNNNLPVSWSIQLASLSNRASAESAADVALPGLQRLHPHGGRHESCVCRAARGAQRSEQASRCVAAPAEAGRFRGALQT